MTTPGLRVLNVFGEHDRLLARAARKPLRNQHAVTEPRPPGSGHGRKFPKRLISTLFPGDTLPVTDPPSPASQPPGSDPDPPPKPPGCRRSSAAACCGRNGNTAGSFLRVPSNLSELAPLGNCSCGRAPCSCLGKTLHWKRTNTLTEALVGVRNSRISRLSA